jgi:hypothetical protein
MESSLDRKFSRQTLAVGAAGGSPPRIIVFSSLKRQSDDGEEA